MQKKLLISIFIFIIILPLFGFNFLISFLGNILALLLLIPLLIVCIAFLSINYLTSKLKQCDNCGSTLIGDNAKCSYCGANLNDYLQNEDHSNEASNKIIEIKAEDIS